MSFWDIEWLIDFNFIGNNRYFKIIGLGLIFAN